MEHPSKQNLMEHRAFLLSLDADEGQAIAAHAGYTPAAQDVAAMEMEQVNKDWALMDAEGLLPHIFRYAHWFAGAILPEEATAADKFQTIQSVTVFTVATISRLKNKGLLETPQARRLTPVMVDPETGEHMTHDIPDEMMEHAAEMSVFLAEEANDLQ